VIYLLAAALTLLFAVLRSGRISVADRVRTPSVLDTASTP
jgi:hypothetical protein